MLVCRHRTEQLQTFDNRGLYEDSGVCFTGGGAWRVGYSSDRGAAGEVPSRRTDHESERGGAGTGGL